MKITLSFLQSFFCGSLLLFGLSTCNAQPAGKIKTEADIEQQIDQLVQQYQALDLFSGVILLAEQGMPIYHKAFGLANRSTNRPNTTETLFDIGSMNKTFTSIVVKQLIGEGKLSYSSKMVDYLDDFTASGTERITVEHLLNHQSGFGDYHSRDYFESSADERKLSAIIERARHMELLFPPGESDEYSNTGFVLLGGIIEAVTGRSYFDEVLDRIVKPLGLQQTYLQDLDQYADRCATGYFYNPLGQLQTADDFQDEPNPDGGFLATAMDVMKFYRSYYYDDVLLSEEIKQDDPFFQFIRQMEPGKAPGAAGGFEGFNTALFQVISDDRTIIVFANMDEPVAENLALGILDLTRGKTPPAPAKPAVQNIREHYEQYGADYIKAHFDSLTVNFHATDPRDFILNALGYAYLYDAQNVEQALIYFQLNTELFPEVANVWDSYGEGLRISGKKEAALQAYKKALALAPNLPSAKEAVAELEKE